MIKYEGIFFDDEESVRLIHSLEREPLPRQYSPLHITFRFNPREEELLDEIVGSEVEVLIIGYGSDGQNSGFVVKLPEDVEPYFINFDEQNPTIKKVPHITASLAPGAKAENTKNLDFEPLEEPVLVKGRIGYWVVEKKEAYISYEPSQNEKTLRMGTKPKKE